LLVGDGAEIETSPELYLNSLIKRYGVQGVVGRVLSGHEIRSMEFALKVYNYYMELKAAPSMASWALENPGKYNLLQDLLQLKAEWGYG